MANLFSTVSLLNCEFTGNVVDDSPLYNLGGGICNDYGSFTQLTSCRIADNAALLGGGIYNANDSEILLLDSVVCSNVPHQIYGYWANGGGNTIADECPIDCPDINGDGYVNIVELLTIIDQWGLTDSPADINDDGVVNVSDLLLIISNWGPCE